MKELFVPYSIALKLKEKGFSEKCFAFYAGNPDDKDYVWKLNITENNWHQHKNSKTAIVAPLYQQVVDWLWDKHMIFISPVRESLGSDEWEFGYHIEWLPKDCWDLKRRGTSFKYENSYTESPGGTYYGAWPTISEALSEAIKKALTLIS